MSKDGNLSFQQHSLFQQGFQRYTPAELKQLEWGLRFTPAVCSLIAAYGLFTQQPAVLFFVALLGIWAFIFPAGHPLDLIYNHLIAPTFAAVKLPNNPLQRRVACFFAGLVNISAAGLFISGKPAVAIGIGVSLLFLQVIVVLTHFCTLSWIYEGVMRFLGHWYHQPVDEFEARLMLKDAVTLVDVRSQNEYAKETLKGALNVPLEDLEQHIETFRNNKCLLFCNRGTRSHIATEKLKELGIEGTYNLGDFNRAKVIVGV